MAVSTFNENSLNEDGLTAVRVNIGDARATVVFNVFDREPSFRVDPITSSFLTTADLSKRVTVIGDEVRLVFNATGRIITESDGYFPRSSIAVSFDANADLVKTQYLDAAAQIFFNEDADLYRGQQLDGLIFSEYEAQGTAYLLSRLSGFVDTEFDVTGESTRRHRLAAQTDSLYDVQSALTAFVRSPVSGSSVIRFDQSAELSVGVRSFIDANSIDVALEASGVLEHFGFQTGVIDFEFVVGDVDIFRKNSFGSQDLYVEFETQAGISSNIFAADPITMSRPFTNREMVA